MTEIEYLKQENKKLVKAINDYGNKNFKYKQALEEIKEDLKPLEAYDIVKTINSKINKILKRC